MQSVLHGKRRYQVSELIYVVPPEYFCNLDANGIRCDISQRPELQFGTVEYVAPKDFTLRDTLPCPIVFAIDVSWQSQQSGLMKCAIEAVKIALSNLPLVEGRCVNNIGLVTYDRSIHFYNLKEALTSPQMIVLPDVNDAFHPLSEGFFVNPTDCKGLIDQALEMIPRIFETNRCTESAFLACLSACKQALANGGRIIAFQSCLPNYGPGALTPRDDNRLVGTDKEKTLYMPQDVAYKTIGEECSAGGIGVDLFIGATSNVDLATISIVSAISGGNIFYYPQFNPFRDINRVVNDLRINLDRFYGFDGLLRIRCSNGTILMLCLFQDYQLGIILETLI
jgi:protein transport protein SEC24